MWTLDIRPLTLLCGARQPQPGGGSANLPAFGHFALPEGWRTCGFLGLPWGRGLPERAGLNGAVWAVVRIEADDAVEIVEEGGAVEALRFHSGFVLYRGARSGALDVLIWHGCDPEGWAGGQRRFADADGFALAGADGIAEAGDAGVARAGARGEAVCGRGGLALAGTDGTAVAGERALAVAGHRGLARCGDHGVAVVRSGRLGRAVAGETGIAVAFGDDAVVDAGGFGVAISGPSAHLVRVGGAGVGIVRGRAEGIDVAEGGLCLHPQPLAEGVVVRLARGAILLHGVAGPGGRTGLNRVEAGSPEAPDAGAYAVHHGHWHRCRAGPDFYAAAHDPEWDRGRDDGPPEPRPAAPVPDVAAPPGAHWWISPWWEVAVRHDPDARCNHFLILEDDTVVLAPPVPDSAHDEAWRLVRPRTGLAWGRGAGSLPEGGACSLLLAKGACCTPVGPDGDVRVESGDVLYKGNLRGAVAALAAMGVDPSRMDIDIGLAGDDAAVRLHPAKVLSVDRIRSEGAIYVDDLPVEPDEIPFDYELDVPVLTGDPTRLRRPALAVAGHRGVAASCGEAHAGEDGIAWGIEAGTARALRRGIALCEHGRAEAGAKGIAWAGLIEETPGRAQAAGGGTARVGAGGLAIVGLPGGSATADDDGVAIAVEPGHAICGDRGLAVGWSRYAVAAKGGRDAVVVVFRGNVCGGPGAVLVARDVTRDTWLWGVVGQDGIAPDTVYTASGGRFVPLIAPALRPRVRRPGG